MGNGGVKVSADYNWYSPNFDPPQTGGSAATEAVEDLSAVTESIATAIEKLKAFQEKANVAKDSFSGLANSLYNVQRVISGDFKISKTFTHFFENLNTELPEMDAEASTKIKTLSRYAEILSESFSKFEITEDKINKVKVATESFTALAKVMAELRVYNEQLNSEKLSKDVPNLISAYQTMVEGLAGSLNVVNGIATFEAVVAKLRDFITVVHEANTAEFANAANNLRAFSPLAQTLQAINDNIKLIGKTEGDIQKSATEGAKVRDGAEFLPSLYKSYSTLVDRINASVPQDEALAKFSKIANSLNTFSNGLTKIVDIQYKLSQNNYAVNILASFKDVKNEKNVATFVENLKNFVTQINGVELDDVNIDRVNRLTKILSSINSVSENIVRLADASKEKGTVQSSIDNATDEIDTIVGRVISFVRISTKAWDKLVKEIATENNLTINVAETNLEKNVGKVKEVVNILHSLVSSINNVKALFSTLKSTDISGYMGQVAALVKIFITSINTMWNEVINEIKDDKGNTSVEILTRRLSADFVNTTTAVNVLEKIGHAFSSIHKADSSASFENVKTMVSNISGVLKQFIDSFDAEFITKIESSKETISRIKELANIIETIASGFKGILAVLSELQAVKEGFPQIMSVFVGFVDEIKATWGKSSLGNLDEDKLIETYTPIINFTKKVASLVESLVSGFKGIRVATALNKDATIENAFSDSDSLLSKCVNGIKQFWDKDVSGIGDSGDKIKEYEPLIKSTKDVASIISLLSNGLAGIATIAADKDALNAPLQNAREVVATFTANLKDFWKVSSATGGAYTKPEEFDENLKRVTKVVSILNVMTNSLTSLDKLGTFKPEETIRPVSGFLTEVAKLVKDKAFKEEEFQKALDKLNIFSRALKQIASFINSSLKMSSSDFKLDIDGIVTKITEFVNKMATLANLPSFSDFEKVANAVSHFKTKLFDATEQVNKSNISFTRFKAILRQIYTAFVGGAVIYSIVRSIKSAIKEVYNLEYAMARINTIARVSSNELKNMTHFVQDVSASYGIASEKVSKALYDINSATIKGVSSLKILEQSAKLAVAGFTDIDKVTNLIARAVNAYEYSVSEAAKISDILFVTVERGINPMEELSEYMGRLFTVSANAGVSLEEVGAGLATLTARGYQTNVASTALNSAILKLSTGTKELNKLFQQYGYASSASALRTMGLTGALQVLYKATNGATEKLHDLGFNYRDIRAATTLASGAISEYNKTLALMNDETYKAGLTNKAYSEVQDTLIFKINRLKETYIVLIQTISEYLNKNQILKQLIDALTKGVEDFKNSVSGMNLSISDQIGAGLTTLLPKLLGIYGIFKLLSPLIKSVGTFMKSGAPLLPAIGKALGPLYVYLTGIYTVFKGLSRLGSIRELSLGDWARAYLNDFSNGIASGIIDGIRKGFATGLGAIFDIIDTALWGTTDFGERIQRWISPTNYKPKEGESTAAGWGQAFTNMRAETLRLNADLKNYKENLAELGYSEEAITAKFNELYTSLQNYAEEQGISEKDFKMFSKVLSTTKEGLIKFNNQIRISRPNLVATQEVFEASSKSISDNFEKITKPMQKAAFEMIGVENALRVVSGGTGMSSVQLRSAFSSPENYAKFINMLGKSFETSPEVRQAIMLLSETFIKTSNDADKFRKSIVSLGTDLQKIVSRNVSIQDIIGNKFNLSSVSDLKDKLFTVLYDPETIKGLNVSALDKYAIPMAEAIKDKLSLDTILDNMVSLLESDPAMEGLTKEQLRNKASSFYDLLRGIVDFTKEFVNALTELDYIKFMNKLEFGGEISAWSQYKKVDSKLIAELMQREIVRGLNFEEAFREFQSNVSSYGYEGAMAMFNKEHQGSFEIFAEYFKEYEKLFGGSSSNLQTEYKNIKKKVEDFFKNYEDTLLTPIQKFKKTNSLLNEQLNILRQQEREGVLDPELMTHIIENAEKLQKLNEEVMTLKVPASITATDAVRTGSKEAFDLIATNIFRDMYKVNVQQKNYQKEIMNIVKDIGNKAGTSTVNIVSYPM